MTKVKQNMTDMSGIAAALILTWIFCPLMNELVNLVSVYLRKLFLIKYL